MLVQYIKIEVNKLRQIKGRVQKGEVRTAHYEDPAAFRICTCGLVAKTNVKEQ